MDSLRIGFVPGVTPGKWLRIWGERMPDSPLDASMVEESDAEGLVRAGELDMCFVRLPVDREGVHLIPLYAEVPVVVLPKEHVLTLLDEVATSDLADEIVHALSPELSAKQAIETVAAGTGVVTVPMSVARLHHRKDVVARPVTDLPETEVGLAWLVGNEDPRIETFIGVVRGRTARSSRAEEPPKNPPKNPPKSKPGGTPRKAQKRAAPAKQAGRRSTRAGKGRRR